MKSLQAYLECDGASTPASTTGMGNPMAPGPDAPGSGDTFDHQKTAKAKKEKRRKSDTEVRWDKKPADLEAFMEGIMDADVDVNDIDLVPSIINLKTPIKEIISRLQALFKSNPKLVSRSKFSLKGNYVSFFYEDGKPNIEIYDKSDQEAISFWVGRSRAVDYDVSIADINDMFDFGLDVVEAHKNWECWKIKDPALWKAITKSAYDVFNVTCEG